VTDFEWFFCLKCGTEFSDLKYFIFTEGLEGKIRYVNAHDSCPQCSSTELLKLTAEKSKDDEPPTHSDAAV
jgi:DNA-directed RNA polymerase subunit RPC12/RpoP